MSGMSGWQRKGALVVFCGVDGSGKTTSVAAAEAYLRERGATIFQTQLPTARVRKNPLFREFIDHADPNADSRVNFLGIQLMDLTSPVWLLLVVLSVQGVGMGAVMAPATESIMSVVPREKAGAGAAVNNSVRQVGGALGVAILGSVLAGAYSANLGRAVDVLPADVRTEARQSNVGTLEAVRAVENGGSPEAARAAAELVEPAREAFVAAMHLTAVGTAAATLLAAGIVLVWLPGRRRRSRSDPIVPPTVDDRPIRRSP